MSSSIVKRMEQLLYSSKSDEKPKQERSAGVTTCTRQRRLRQMQAELITVGSLTIVEDCLGENLNENLNIEIPSIPPSEQKHLATEDNHGVVAIKDLIDARIAQTEGPKTAPTEPSVSKDDQNRTLLNLESIAASIYFWSPYASWGKEDRTSKFMQGKVQGRTCSATNDVDVHRNKDTFVNFSQPALIMVAGNAETPASTLKWLAAHHSPEVRKAVAQNENTDDETLALLSDDFDSNVLSAVLDNPRISRDLAVKLASSKNFSIASKARNIYGQLDIKSKQPRPLNKKSGNADEMMQDEREFLKVVADSADTSRRLIVKSPRLAADWHIRMLVAGDPNATAEILWQLASHPISQVKRKLVDKYNCLLETVVNLKGYKKRGAHDALAASATETIN